jgi:WD40 repeat protein
MKQSVRLLGASLTFALTLAVPRASAGEDAIWNHASDGSWCGRVVSVGNDGTQVFTQAGGWGAHAWLLSSHDADPPEPFLDEGLSGAAMLVAVSSARMAPVHASIQQTLSGSNRIAVLRKYSSDDNCADWSWTFPFWVVQSSYCGVQVSADGSRIIAIVYDYTTGKNRLSVFDSESGQLLTDSEIPMSLGIQTAQVSGDGSVICLVSQNQLVIYEVESATALHSHYLFGQPNLGALAISEDGSCIAYGSLGEVYVYRRAGNEYVEAFTCVQPPDTWCEGVAVSVDGSTIAFGFQVNTGPAGLQIGAVDVNSQAVLMSRSLSAEHENRITDLSISADGSRIAVGCIGGTGGQFDEVSVFATARGTRLSGFDLTGMVNDLEISPDGTVIAVAHTESNTDNNEGGGIALLETCARGLVLRDLPKVGTTVTFEQCIPPGSVARIISSPALDPAPMRYPGVGTLFLQRCEAMEYLPHGTQAGGGVYETHYAIPNDSALIGTTIYFQGLGLSPRGLSDNYVKMTILP